MNRVTPRWRIVRRATSLRASQAVEYKRCPQRRTGARNDRGGRQDERENETPLEQRLHDTLQTRSRPSPLGQARTD